MSFIYLQMTGSNGQKFLLPDGVTGIGRNSQNSIQIDASYKNVSGHHAIIYKTAQRIIIQDLQSTNGTFVNGKRITEQELQINDELGLGMTGPRFKLIESQYPPGCEEAEEVALPADKPSPSIESPEKQLVSMTGEIEYKILKKELASEDMRKLLDNRERLSRIIERGRIGQTQSILLKSAFLAANSGRKKLLYIFSTVLIVAAVLISFFAIRAHQYKTLLDEAKALKTEIAMYDKKISEIKKGPGNRERLEKLISDIETKQKELSTLTNRFNTHDFQGYYSDPLEKKIDDILKRYGETDYFIPEEMVERVRHHIDVFTGAQKNLIRKFMKRKDLFFPMIHRVFSEKKLPAELAYIAMLESGFDPLATSSAGARGIWQLMPNTARRFGLIVNDTLDQRTDPEKSTLAAAEYFRELIGIFGSKSSVMLCMAAYNAGERRIMNALRKIEDPLRNRDFWYIYRMGILTEETNEYIPRVIALMIISENPEEYNLL